MRSALALLIVLLAGCAELNPFASPEPVYYLSPYPTEGGCRDDRCRQIDRLEAELYKFARSGRIRWVQLVDTFYATRNELFPNSPDTDFVREIRAYQRVLAEQMDARTITESQWVYLNQKKANELNARSQMIENTRPRATSCTTRNVGTPNNPVYQTFCN